MSDPEETIRQFEQMSGVLKNTAVLLGDYFQRLQEQGFSREEAFVMVLEYQEMVLGRVGRGAEETDA